MNPSHVNDVDVLDAHEGQVLEQLAAESTGADDEHPEGLPEEGEEVGRRLEAVRVVEGSAPLEHLGEVVPPARPVSHRGGSVISVGVNLHHVFVVCGGRSDSE